MTGTLTGGFLKKKYNKMLIASLLGWVVAIVGELSDSIIGGLFISEDAISATGIVAPIFSVLYFLACLIGIGSANVYSVYVGNFDTDNSHRLCGMSLLFSLGTGALLAFLMAVGKGLFFSMYDLSPEIYTLASDYYSCFIVMAFIYPVYWLVYYLVAADGDSDLILAVDVFTAFGNAAFSIIFVQKWGVKGLAFGTVFSLILSSVFLIAHFFKKENSIKFKFCFDFGIAKKIVVSGSTSSLTTLYVAIIDIVMNKYIIDHFGDSYLAAYTIINFMLNLAECFMCTTDAGGPFIGISYGEKNSVSLRKILNMCLRQTFGVSVGFAVVFFVGAKYVPSLYGITTPEIVKASIYAVRVLSISYIFSGPIYMWINYFPRVDREILGNITCILYSLITPIVFSMPMGKWWGFNGMVWGFFLTPVVSGLICSLYIILKLGKKAFPFAVNDSEDKIFIHEFAVRDEEIALLNETIHKELTDLNIDKNLVNRIEMMVEETFVIVKKYNEGKNILADCTLMIGEHQIRLITRDNGRIFDITKVDEDIKSLEHYVAARLMESTQEKIYMTAVSFNRNSYLWNY